MSNLKKYVILITIAALTGCANTENYSDSSNGDIQAAINGITGVANNAIFWTNRKK